MSGRSERASASSLSRIRRACSNAPDNGLNRGIYFRRNRKVTRVTRLRCYSFSLGQRAARLTRAVFFDPTKNYFVGRLGCLPKKSVGLAVKDLQLGIWNTIF